MCVTYTTNKLIKLTKMSIQRLATKNIIAVYIILDKPPSYAYNWNVPPLPQQVIYG